MCMYCVIQKVSGMHKRGCGNARLNAGQAWLFCIWLRKLSNQAPPTTGNLHHIQNGLHAACPLFYASRNFLNGTYVMYEAIYSVSPFDQCWEMFDPLNGFKFRLSTCACISTIRHLMPTDWDTRPQYGQQNSTSSDITVTR